MDFKSINKVIWGTVGIVVGLLILVTIFASLIRGGMSYYRYRTHHVSGVAVNAPVIEPPKPGQLQVTVQYEMPAWEQKSDYYFIPVDLEKKIQAEEPAYDISRSVEKSRLNYYRDNGAYNFVVMNKKTGESRLLLDKKAYVQGPYFIDVKDEAKPLENKPVRILFKIAFEDTNQDGVLNNRDTLVGYLSNLDGTNLIQITPEKMQLERWQNDAESKKLFLTVSHDTNDDHKFNLDDPKFLLAVSIDDPKMGTEVVSKEIQDQVNALLK